MIREYGAPVQRRRLYAALDAGTQRRVTIVSGPAGSGKTVLVDTWLQEKAWAGSVARVTGEPRDGFVMRLAEALGGLAAPILLVLDDLERLPAKTVAGGIAALLASGPAELRLLLITRRELRLGLHRLRVAGHVAEIRGDDLAFTVDEAQELLTTAGVDLSGESLARLSRYTEGWAAGLRLAALGLGGRSDPDRFVDRFCGAERTVAEYLTGEVLESQRPAVRRLLRRTSVLESVNGPLANLLTGWSDSDRTLLDLEAANAFVSSIDADRTWFRYHPLLAGVLKMELRRDGAADIEALHRAAARWYAANGRPLEAIRHAQAGREWRYAAGLLLRNWLALCVEGQQAEIGKLLAAFPVEVAVTDPTLAAITAGNRLASAAPDVADGYLALAEDRARSVPKRHRDRFDVTLAIAHLIRGRARGDFDAVTRTAEAILDRAHREVWPDIDDLRAVALLSIGCVELWAVRLDEAERHLGESLALARSTARPYVVTACLGYLAHVANLKEQPELAEARSREAIALADGLGWSDDAVVGPAYLALSAGVLSAGRFEEAERWLEAASQALSRVLDPEATVALPVTRGILRYVQGRYDEAIKDLRAAERAPAPHYLSASATTWRLRACISLGDTEPARAAVAQMGGAAPPSADWCNVSAHLHLADDDPASALEAARPVVDGSAPAFHVNLEIQASLLVAVAHDRLGQSQAAEAALENALALAEPKGHVCIVMTVPGVAPLLARHPRHRTAHGAFLTELLDRLAGTPSPGLAAEAMQVTQLLSARERDVLGFLPTNLTAAEIAEAMFLSPHTVKTHMRNLYAKLGAHRRADAVARARALGVLAPERWAR